MDTAEILYLRNFKPYKINQLIYIDWAILQIEKGNDFEELFELAGLYRNHVYAEKEVEIYFNNCLKKLGIKKPITNDEVLTYYCCFMCKEIIDKCNDFDSLYSTFATFSNNIEDFHTMEMEPLLRFDIDLEIVEHNGTPKYHSEMNINNALSTAKEIAIQFINKNS